MVGEGFVAHEDALGPRSVRDNFRLPVCVVGHSGWGALGVSLYVGDSIHAVDGFRGKPWPAPPFECNAGSRGCHPTPSRRWVTMVDNAHEIRQLCQKWLIPKIIRDNLFEIAVAGRSNVGKSSLINRFANRRRLAKVSNTPGRTQLLNFFVVNDHFSW